MAPPGLAATADLLLATTAIDRLSLGVPVGAPWDAARGGRVRRPVAGDVDPAQHDRRPRPFLNLDTAGLRPVFGPSFASVAALRALLHRRRRRRGHTRDVRAPFGTRNGAKQDRIDGGAGDRAAAGQAARTARRGRSRSAGSSPAGCVNVISDGLTARRHVIVALPPALASRIQYAPRAAAARRAHAAAAQGRISSSRPSTTSPSGATTGSTARDLRRGPATCVRPLPPDGTPGALLGSSAATRRGASPDCRSPRADVRAGKHGARVWRRRAVAG